MDDPSPAQAPDPGTPEAPAPVPAPRRSPLAMVVAVAVALSGVVWILQGLGILEVGNSFMTGDRLWAVIGAMFIVAGVALGIRARRRPA